MTKPFKWIQFKQILVIGLAEIGAKVFGITYCTWMIVFFQKMHRLARKHNEVNPDLKISFDEIVDFIEDTHRLRHYRPVMFPDVIYGHCLIPNSKLMLEEFDPEMLKLMLERMRRK